MWRTEQDVINDLQEVTGVRMRLDKNYVARAGQPPPRCNVFEDDYDEYKLRFGDVTTENEITAPDLAGITQMLRMVDDSRSPKNKVNAEPKEKHKTEIVVSKLNPNVMEFIPQGLACTGALGSNAEGENNVIGINKENIKDTTSVSINACVEDEEKTKLINDLHKTIGDNRNETNFDKKRARNVALAALLKLHSSPSPTSTSRSSPCAPELTQTQSPKASASPAPPVLFTPEYYAGASSFTLEEKGTEGNGLPPIFTPQSSPSPTNVDPYIKESVTKVEKWLNVPEKTKATLKIDGPYIGPITFKKKNSPISASPAGSEKATKIHEIPKFVPTTRTHEYRQEMEERVKAKKEFERKKMNLWEKLEHDLKERDKLIKDKLKVSVL